MEHIRLFLEKVKQVRRERKELRLRLREIRKRAKNWRDQE
jgi:hypothetical protein